MTTEQMALVKKLIQKHEIEATDAEWTLIFMGVGYGLSEQQIDSYLVMNTTDLLAKHEKMLCILLGMDSETQGATNEIQNPAERIQFMLENHFQRKKLESGYESVMQYVIEDSDLSAAQIEQLRKAVEAGMPAEDILEMAKKRKDVMEIRRCIEFYEMMQQKGKQENVKKSRRTKDMKAGYMRSSLRSFSSGYRIESIFQSVSMWNLFFCVKKRMLICFVFPVAD